MIFAFYEKVAVKLGDERYTYDRSSLMFKEVVDLETVSGYSYAEWEYDLGRYSIRAVAALVHILRKRAGVPSDFETMDFAADKLECVPLHDDGREYTRAEIAEDVMRRTKEAQDPTSAAASGNGHVTTGSTSPGSRSGSESGRGSGKSSRGKTSTPAKPTSTEN